MFGNRLMYTQSPGGKRRGLVYQSSDSGIIITGNKIYFGTTGNNIGTPMNIMFKKTGEIVLNIPDDWFNNYSYLSWTATSSKIILNDRWYPLSITPIYKIKIDNVTIDLNDFDTIVDVNNKFMFKKENFTCYGYDNSMTTLEFLVLYYDITNIPIITVNNEQYYDFRGLETGHEFLIQNKRYKYDITKTILLEISANMRYFTYMGDQTFRYYFPDGSGYADGQIGGINALNHGTSKVNVCIAKNKRPYQSSPILEHDSQNSGVYRYETKGSAGIKLNGSPGSAGYYNPILFGAPQRALEMTIYSWNTQTKQETTAWTGRFFYRYNNAYNSNPSDLPSTITTGGGMYSMMLPNFVMRMIGSLFEVPAFFVGSSVINGLQQLKPVATCIEYSNNYSRYGVQGIVIPTLDEYIQSDYPYPI